jgi:uncharacterized repeat protein (TIGR04042 family)
MRCYSPSLVVREYLEVGRAYSVSDFLDRTRTLLNIGSERVRAKFGFACSSAMDQLAIIEERGAGCTQDDLVQVTAFELPAGVEEARNV